MTKEECASKLHLLQQEYEAMKHDRDVYLTVSQRSGQDLYELHQKHAHLQQEYDKLKVEYEKDFYQAELNYEVLLSEHAALQAKSEAYEKALKEIEVLPAVGPLTFKIKEIVNKAMSYNSNTNNQNENNGGE